MCVASCLHEHSYIKQADRQTDTHFATDSTLTLGIDSVTGFGPSLNLGLFTRLEATVTLFWSLVKPGTPAYTKQSADTLRSVLFVCSRQHCNRGIMHHQITIYPNKVLPIISFVHRKVHQLFSDNKRCTSKLHCKRGCTQQTSSNDHNARQRHR